MLFLFEFDFLRMDFLAVGFLELVVFFHDLILVAIIYVNIDNLFTLFYGFVLLFQAKFFTQLPFELFPFLVLANFCPSTVIQGRCMGLIVLWMVREDMRIHIECFQMISVNDPADWLVRVCSAVALRSCFAKVILEFRIGKAS